MEVWDKGFVVAVVVKSMKGS